MERLASPLCSRLNASLATVAVSKQQFELITYLDYQRLPSKTMLRQLFLCAVVALVSTSYFLEACTNLLVQKSASTDNSNIIAYNADASNFYTTIYHYPAGLHTNGTMRKIWTWE